MGLLIQNGYIQLWRTEKKDIPFIVEAEKAEENAEYVGQWSCEQHEHALNHADVLHLLIKAANGSAVGYAIIRGLTNLNDSIEFMRIVITQKGFGYGKHALALIKEWCFEIQGAHRLWLGVREHNVRAQHVYESLGFVREGLLRECVKVGDVYRSLIVMSILKDE